MPESGAYLPKEQLLHDDEANIDEVLPGSQLKHTEELVGEYLP